MKKIMITGLMMFYAACLAAAPQGGRIYNVGDLRIVVPTGMLTMAKQQGIQILKQNINGVEYLSIPHFVTTLLKNDGTKLTSIVDLVAYSKECEPYSQHEKYLSESNDSGSQTLVEYTAQTEQFQGNVYLTHTTFPMGSVNVFKMYLAAFDFKNYKCYSLDLQIQNVDNLSIKKIAKQDVIKPLISSIEESANIFSNN